MKVNRYVLRLLPALLFVIAPLVSRAQFTSPAQTSGSIPSTTLDKTATPPTSAENGMFSSAVDPTNYHVGPGDVMQVRFWTSDQAFYPAISSDELLVVNRVGEFSTHGKTLAQLRDEVYQKAAIIFESYVKTHAATGEHPMTLSLYQPRRVYVKVDGDVLTPSGFVLGASTRADVAVDLANKELQPTTNSTQDPSLLMRIQSEREQRQRVQALFGKQEAQPPSKRYITIAHADGSMDRLDLVRYNATHDPKSSPMLREGDVINVPFRDRSAGVIGVYGAVHAPGEFEFVENDSLSSVIKYAYGPTAQADLEHVEITSATGGQQSTKTYNLRAIMSGAAPDPTLSRGDRVVVRSKNENVHAAVVAVRGEVQQPGSFPIEDGVTKLSDVIQQAGGLTPQAYPAGSRVLRHGRPGLSDINNYEEMQRTGRLANLTVEDTASFLKQMSMRPTDVVVDLDRLLAHGDKSLDIALEDGDEIVIANKPSTVYVSGFVHRSGYIPYQDGAPLSYYISRASGYAEGSVPSETVVIKAGSKAWLDPSNTKIEPGDEIYVPKKADIPIDVQRNQITSYSQLALAVLTFALTIYNTFKKQ